MPTWTWSEIAVRRSHRWTRAGDVLVLMITVVLVFDPHLHLDVSHHNWFLGVTNAIMQGKTLLVDVVSAYGVLS